MENLDKAAIISAIDEVAENVKNIAREKITGFTDSGFVSLAELEKWKDDNLKNSRAVYIFTVDSTFKTKNLVSAICAVRYPNNITESQLAVSQVNDLENRGKEECLYVGSTEKIKKRIGEHLNCGKSNSALHLENWFGKVSGSGKIKLTAIELAPDTSDDDRQDLEDLLWKRFRPMMGKQGPKARQLKKN